MICRESGLDDTFGNITISIWVRYGLSYNDGKGRAWAVIRSIEMNNVPTTGTLGWDICSTHMSVET